MIPLTGFFVVAARRRQRERMLGTVIAIKMMENRESTWYICGVTAVRLISEEIQLVSYLRSIVFGVVSVKRLIHRNFLEECDREDLEQCVERSVETEALLDDGDEDVDRDGDPDLGLHGIFGCPEEPFDP